MMWEYRAFPMDVIDGDTIDVYIDQGFQTFRQERLRLLKVNTPEIKGDTKAEGLKSKKFVEEWLGMEKGESEAKWSITIKTEKSDSFGRYLAMVYNKDGECLNDLLLEKGLAVPYKK